MNCNLKSLEAIHLKVVEASPDAKIVIDGEGRVLIFNAMAELLFGYAREDVLSQPIEILLPEESRDQHVSHRNGYFCDPKTREMGDGMLLEARHRNGSKFPVQIKLAPIIVPGEGVLCLAVVRRVKDDLNAKGAAR